MREKNLTYLSPRGLAPLGSMVCPSCQIQKREKEMEMWIETYYDENGQEHKAKVCHNCGHIKSVK